MNLQHVNAKIFVAGDLTIDLERFIEIFHVWVAEQSMPEMLIDVADYAHVPDGPGVVLVGLESDYAIDHRGNQFGLLYNRKAALDGSNEDRIRHSLCSAAKACLLLEDELDGLKFSRQKFELVINDRALAPNTAEVRGSCQEIFTQSLQGILGHDQFSLEFDQQPRNRLAAVVSLESPLDLDRLAER